MAMFVNTRGANFYAGNAANHLGGQKEAPATQLSVMVLAAF
jgi:hypothetical protein